MRIQESCGLQLGLGGGGGVGKLLNNKKKTPARHGMIRKSHLAVVFAIVSKVR